MEILITTEQNSQKAEQLARLAIENKLAACVQIIPKITSIYFWEGAVQKAEEALLIIKTTAEKSARLEEFVRANHSYEIPEIAFFAADKIDAAYAQWLKNYLTGDS